MNQNVYVLKSLRASGVTIHSLRLNGYRRGRGMKSEGEKVEGNLDT